MRVALTLKVGCGLSVHEIAAGLLKEPATIAQGLARAKRRLRERGATLDMPDPARLAERLDGVLDAICVAFAEGHASAAGEHQVRPDICAEALRLAEAVAGHPVVGKPEARALAALLLFQAARLPARTDTAGDLVLLADQDRALWDRRLIARGFDWLAMAASGDRLSEYHALTGIASEHARAARFEDTDWPAILDWYDRLVALAPSPTHRLNRAVAVAFARSPAAGLAALDELAGEPVLRTFHRFHATRAELSHRAGRTADARAAWGRALACAPNEPTRRCLARRLRELETGTRQTGQDTTA